MEAVLASPGLPGGQASAQTQGVKATQRGLPPVVEEGPVRALFCVLLRPAQVGRWTCPVSVCRMYGKDVASASQTPSPVTPL